MKGTADTFLESVLLELVFSQWHRGLVFGLYRMILGGDIIDYGQYIYGRIEAPIPCQSRPRDEAILL